MDVSKNRGTPKLMVYNGKPNKTWIYILPETNILVAPENGWFLRLVSFWEGSFSGAMLVS